MTERTGTTRLRATPRTSTRSQPRPRLSGALGFSMRSSPTAASRATVVSGPVQDPLGGWPLIGRLQRSRRRRRRARTAAARSPLPLPVRCASTGGSSPSSRAPPMSRPSFSGVASSGSRMSTIRPWYMTAIRSASARTSSSSVLTMSTAAPSSRFSTIRRWMYSIEPTSRPRVGCAATRSLIGRENSRATITFCWFPPDRFPTSLKIVGVRMSYWPTSSVAVAMIASRWTFMPFAYGGR